MTEAAKQEPHSLDRFVDRREAAQILGVQPATLADWAVRGCGPEMVKMGRSVRYAVRALTEFTLTRTVSSTAKFGRGA
jgi:predicted DNA-binding transcriptional regulator AlpA